jgi:N-acetylglucosamine-6-phosphate deacetylase
MNMARAEIEQPGGRLALINGTIILPNEMVAGHAIVIEGPKILGIAALADLGSETSIFDVGRRYITPGLIDIHTHGAAGFSFNQPTDQAFSAIVQENALRGVTSVLATISTASISEIVRCLEFTRAWMSKQHTGAQVLGVHLEGPYFCFEQKGAQDPSNLRTPDDGSVDLLLEHHPIIRIMSFAPELPGAVQLTEKLASLGIVPAAGHSCAQEESIGDAMAAGLKHIIHIWSGQSTTIREGPWRKPGLLETSLVYEGLTVEMIADNRHLPPTLMKMAYKCIGPDRLVIISDAISGAGLGEDAHFDVGEMSYIVTDGVGMMLDRTNFAGSTTLLNQMIPILVETVGIPLVEVVRMMTLNPAKLIGYKDSKGSLAEGKDADLALFNDDFSAWKTMIGGRWV